MTRTREGVGQRGRERESKQVTERQNAVDETYTGAVATSPAPRSTRHAGAPTFSGKPSEADVPAPGLPAAPSRDDVQGALEAVVPDARACAPEHRGAVVPRTLRRARVAEFVGDRFVVAYPLRL